MINMTEDLELKYRELQDKIDQFLAGQCTAADVKKLSAPFGVYAEKDGNYMARVRSLNGTLTPQQINDVADIMIRNGIYYAHFTSRRNMQLHGVPPENVYSTLVDCGTEGMVFKGGGGNTFRSIAGSPYAGVSPAESFDTTPYMEAVWQYVFGYEKAFTLGRKFKLGFSAGPADEANCGVQDMGLLAVIRDGEPGFKVYGAGGLGRGGSVGIELIDFLPAERVVQAVAAAIDLFSDHGDRENRANARLRFLRHKLGDDAFRNLYHEYLEKSDAPLLQDVKQVDYAGMIKNLVVFNDPCPESDLYKGWYARSVKETRFNDVVSVRLFIRKGLFRPENLKTIASGLRETGASFIRLTPQQDLVIPMVHRTALPCVFKMLAERLTGQAVIDGRFSRQVVSCIGSRICAMGLIDSSGTADEIAVALDDLFADYQDIRDEVYEEVIDAIRVSGCGSSCAGNQIAALGFHGHKVKIDDILTDIFYIHIGGNITEDDHCLSVNRPEWWIRTHQAAELTVNIVKEYLDECRAGKKCSLR